jgi:hypothetical protein
VWFWAAVGTLSRIGGETAGLVEECQSFVERRLFEIANEHKSRCHTAYVAASWWQTASTLGSQLRMFQRYRLGSPSQRVLDGHTISNPTQWATCPTASQRNRIIALSVSATTRPHNRSQLVLPTNRNGGDAAARHNTLTTLHKSQQTKPPV